MESKEFVLGTWQQQEYKWRVIVDLFFVGVGAGLFTIALIPGFILGMIIGGGLVMAGGLVLIGDLPLRQNAWRLIARPKSSWMSRGVIGNLSFAVLAVAYIVNLVIQPGGLTLLGAPWVSGPVWLMVLGILAGVAGLFVASYTGFLLGNMRAIPFWNNSYTPALFLVSALLGGLGAMYLFPLDWKLLPWVLPILQDFGIILVVIELCILLSLIGVPHSETTRESIRKLTQGSLRPHFLIGLLGLGLIAPLIILVFVRTGVGSVALMPIVGALLLVGMFLSRYTILKAGIHVSPV
jgi:formate-dependent nitrite reductase membrane component NrfD